MITDMLPHIVIESIEVRKPLAYRVVHKLTVGLEGTPVGAALALIGLLLKNLDSMTIIKKPYYFVYIHMHAYCGTTQVERP